jgi:zinc protease
MLDFAADILDVVFTRTLREEEGGTYSPQCGSDLNYYTKDWTLYSIYLTGDESKDKLAKRAAEETYKLLSEGATEDDFNKVKGAALNQQDINSKTNSYWLSGLKEYNNHGQHFAAERAATIEGITLDKLNAFMKRLANSKNNIDVILNGVAKN